MLNDPSSKWEKIDPKPINPPENKPSKSSYSAIPVSSGEAQKKFGGAKAISSQQFFSDSANSAVSI